MRRSDYDVTDSIRVTDPLAVAAEVGRIYKDMFGGPRSAELKRAFHDADLLYRGKHPDYCACDTEYHDIQHVLDVTLAMARLMDGYQRSLVNGSGRLTKPLFIVGAIAALFHDFGYLRRRQDHRHRYGAEYTLVHVSRGATFLRRYVHRLGLGREMAELAATLVHFTGYERPAETIRLSGERERRLGQMLGTADIIAQMADRCYLEKCRDRLYPEFVLGRIAGEARGIMRSLPVYVSGEELVNKTPSFYVGAKKRLSLQLARSYDYATRYFGGDNLYLDEMEKNVRHAERVAQVKPVPAEMRELLRRQPPRTLMPDAVPYPKTLVGL
ncbi:MAG TPA: HD domain-containing protein [Burkholderiales bacterium]|nr:HD domain-containing protein [Burkholderiales bacterium]